MSARKRIAAISLIGAGFALAMADAASACFYNAAPAQRVNHSFDAIVIVRVTAAGYTRSAEPDWHPWEAAGSLVRPVEGNAGMTDFQFERSGSSMACDDGLDPPTAGEEWVLYLRRYDGVMRVAQSYPLALARQIDPRFAR